MNVPENVTIKEFKLKDEYKDEFCLTLALVGTRNMIIDPIKGGKPAAWNATT